MIVTFIRILRPEFQSTVNGRRITPQSSDYIIVPRLSTHGIWKTVDLLPFETLAALSVVRDELASNKSRMVTERKSIERKRKVKR